MPPYTRTTVLTMVLSAKVNGERVKFQLLTEASARYNGNMAMPACLTNDDIGEHHANDFIVFVMIA